MAKTTGVNGAPPVHIVLVLDESGSMDWMRSKVVDGVNKLLDGLKADDTTPVNCTIVIFNDTARVLVDHKPAAQIKPLSGYDYDPHSGTGLLDGVGMALDAAEAATGYNERALVAIITDGEENDSRIFKHEEIQARIKNLLQTSTWAFAFFGADDYSAEVMGEVLGIPKSMVSAFHGSSTFTKIKAVAAKFRQAVAQGQTPADSVRLTQIQTGE